MLHDVCLLIFNPEQTGRQQGRLNLHVLCLFYLAFCLSSAPSIFQTALKIDHETTLSCGTVEGINMLSTTSVAFKEVA